MGQVLVLGLIAGGIYALFAVGVVLVYRGTGVLTFANGEIGTASLFLGAILINDVGLPWLVGAAVAVLFAVALGALFELLVVRHMIGADPVSVAVATVGLGLFLLALEFQIFGESPEVLGGPVDAGFVLAGVRVTPTQVAALVIAIGLAFGLQSALRRTDFGLGILAAAQDPTAVRLVGVPLSRVSLTIWGAGAGLAALAAFLVVPTVGVFAPGYASELYIVGLAAAVIGGLKSLPGAFVGGITLGIAEAAATRYLGDLGLSGLRYVVVLAILLLVLLGRAYLPELRRQLMPTPAAETDTRQTAGARA